MPSESLRGIPRRSLRRGGRHNLRNGGVRAEVGVRQEPQLLLSCGGRLFLPDGTLSAEQFRLPLDVLRTRVWIDLVICGSLYRIQRAECFGFYGVYVPSERPALVQRQSGGRALVTNDSAFAVVSLSSGQQNRNVLSLDRRNGLPLHFKAGCHRYEHYLVDSTNTRPNLRIKLRANAPLYVERRVHVPASAMDLRIASSEEVMVDYWVKDLSFVVPSFRLSSQERRSYAG